MLPTLSEYRFVASKFSGMQYTDKELNACHPVIANPSAMKRHLLDASSESGIYVPLTHRETVEYEDGATHDPMLRRDITPKTSFSAEVETSAGVGLGTELAGNGYVRRPRGAFGAPVYQHDIARALQCAFPGCDMVLTGKRIETVSHMRYHFQRAVDVTLECPWPADSSAEGAGSCGVVFDDWAHFGRHVSSKHIRSEMYQCNRCSQSFARRDAALRHMKTVCGEGSNRRFEKRARAMMQEYEEGDYSI